MLNKMKNKEHLVQTESITGDIIYFISYLVVSIFSQ